MTECVHCSLPIIGGGHECPACRESVASQSREAAFGQRMLILLVVVQLVGMAVGLVLLTWRGCS